MRYEKKVVVLSSALVALLAIWVLGIVFSPERVAARSESAHLIAGKSSEVASIGISSPATPEIELAKSGAAWELADGSLRFPVRADRVSSFLSDLAAVSRLRLVARSKDSWAGFKLDDAQAKRAVLKDSSGKVLADIFVGGYGPTGSETYLRRSGTDASYLVEAGIASYLGYGRSGWLDLALLAGVKESDVQSVSIKSSIDFPEGGKAVGGKGVPATKLDYVLKREAQGWKSGAARIDAEAVAALLRSIVGLAAEDYVAAPPAEAFAKIGAALKLELGTGKSIALEVGGEAGKDRYYARLGDGGRVAVVSAYSLRACLKSLAEISKK
jgi:hypothetical protein